MAEWRHRLKNLKEMQALVETKSLLLRNYPKNHYYVMLGDAKRRASNWELCYVGEKKKTLKRLGVKFDSIKGNPVNNVDIDCYGFLFQLAVVEERFSDAENLADKIDSEMSRLTQMKVKSVNSR